MVNYENIYADTKEKSQKDDKFHYAKGKRVDKYKKYSPNVQNSFSESQYGFLKQIPSHMSLIKNLCMNFVKNSNQRKN